MPNALHIRRATPDDCDAIYRTHHDSVEQLCRAYYDARQISMWMDGRTPAMYLDAIARGALWVADDGAIRGFAEVDGNELSKLFVAGADGGRGIGSRLLGVALAAIAASGAGQVILEATVGAVAFYEKHGFRITGSGCFLRGNSAVRIDIVQMALQLTPR